MGRSGRIERGPPRTDPIGCVERVAADQSKVGWTGFLCFFFFLFFVSFFLVPAAWAVYLSETITSTNEKKLKKN